ncbi:MAG TPA: DUF3516 domain-containing protein [Myxococcota bacterium]|nr:DUF3516 domain-containing protein [Myxococcota bacterium]
MAEPARLDARAQRGLPPAEILARFVAWCEARGLRPYPAQEEAFLEILEDKHVVLATPTGSGKSLVAQLVHFKALCEGARSFYTSPVKALVSEKFFALCADFGAENVGMLTGDASINPGAAIVCCTAEVLANMALRRGAALDVPYAVLDEFHFYSDPSRGWAWQVPLLVLPRTVFLLMSATLGDTSAIRRDLAARSGRAVALVASDDRPVPLDYAWRETPLHETVSDLLEAGKAPVYVVSFTQREAAELAQGLASLQIATRELRDRIARALGDFQFDSPYGKELARLVRAGIGIHHAGLLPKYRLLVEQLSQQGLLQVISGTDTLGVGVNIPIRTVLFTKLAKYDGRKVGPLSVREFKQIAGRAGRKGFDERGSVVCQAPEHVIENRRMRARAAGPGRKKREVSKKPPPGFVGWTEDTFKKLIERTPEPLVSRFRMTHGMLVLLLRQGEEAPDPRRAWRVVAELVVTSHEDERHKRRLLRSAAQLFRGLRAADIVRLERDAATGLRRVRVAQDLQWDFSLHHALSLYLVEAISYVEARDEAFALEVLSLVEAVLDDPRALLLRQMDRIKSDLFTRLKAEGVPYEERMRRLDEVEPPAPSKAFIEQTFAYFALRHPWVQREDVRPKSIARELVEGYWDFDHYVRFYGLQRMEGLLLRYLGEVYGSLVQTVPAGAKTDAVQDVIAYLRALLERVDTSLVAEWERLLHPELRTPSGATPAQAPAVRAYDLAADPRELRARVRAELHRLVRALAAGDWEEAARCVHRDPDEPWTPARFERALAPFREEYGEIVFTPRARANEWTRLEPDGPRRWRATQVLVDRADDNLWSVFAEVDLSGEHDPVGPLLRLDRIGV